MINNKEEYILCSAIHYFDVINDKCLNLPINIDKGLVICGRRHDNCIFIFHTLTGLQTNSSNSIQGFLTSKNRFIDRQEAVFIAMLSGQIDREKANKITQLYSEDLW